MLRGTGALFWQLELRREQRKHTEGREEVTCPFLAMSYCPSPRGTIFLQSLDAKESGTEAVTLEELREQWSLGKITIT